MKKADKSIGERFRTLFGSYGAGARVAEATGLSQEHVSRVFSGAKAGKTVHPPEYLLAIAELLEALPPKDWPERWRGR